jgi:hypothetical protein
MATGSPPAASITALGSRLSSVMLMLMLASARMFPSPDLETHMVRAARPLKR